MKKKAIFFDIDGTLITRDNVFSEDDRQAMEEAAGRGHFLFLNSGRSFANIPPALLDLPSLKGIAAGGGAHILLASSPAGETRFGTIYRKWISEETLEKVFAWYGKQTKCCFLEGERDCYIINRTSRIELVRTPVPVKSLDDLKRKSGGDPITKLTFDGFLSEEEYSLLEPDLTVNRFADYSEGIVKGENKAKAMGLILGHLGLRREDSIAIGDGQNDLDMIRFAGLGIAMGNACAELKAAAGAVTGDCGKGGVAEALRKFAP